MQQETIKTDSNDFFIGNIWEANILSTSEEKNLYPLLMQCFASSVLPLEKSKPSIQGDLRHPWPQCCAGMKFICLLPDLCCCVLRGSPTRWLLLEGMDGLSSSLSLLLRKGIVVPWKHSLTSLDIFKERYQRLNGELMGDQDSWTLRTEGEESYTKPVNG